MKKDNKHFKFINNETGNAIYYLSVSDNEGDITTNLEETRHNLAIEHGIYIGSIYYIEVSENPTSE